MMKKERINEMIEEAKEYIYEYFHEDIEKLSIEEIDTSLCFVCFRKEASWWRSGCVYLVFMDDKFNLKNINLV